MQDNNGRDNDIYLLMILIRLSTLLTNTKMASNCRWVEIDEREKIKVQVTNTLNVMNLWYMSVTTLWFF